MKLHRHERDMVVVLLTTFAVGLIAGFIGGAEVGVGAYHFSTGLLIIMSVGYLFLRGTVRIATRLHKRYTNDD